ncbi:MAG: ATP-binding protein [Rhodospirillales bacterium]
MSPNQSTIFTALQAMSDGVALFDADDRLVFCNDRFKQFVTPIADKLVPGLSWREGCAAAWDAGLAPVDRADREAWIEERGHQHRAGDQTVERQLGADRWVRVSDRSLTSGELVTVISDITSQKQAELALLESRERFRAFAEIASDFFFEQDAALRISFVSARLQALTGLPESEVLGHTAEALLRRWLDPRSPTFQRFRRAQITHAPFEGVTLALPRDDGILLHLRLSGQPVLDQAGAFAGFRGVGFDVTQETLNKQRLEDALAEAESAARAKSAFLATVSHELRTPLTSIHGVLSLMHGGALGDLSEAQRRMVKTALDNSERLSALVNDLLDLEKLQAGKLSLDLEPLALDDLLTAVVGNFQAQALNAGIQLVRSKTETPEATALVVQADRRRLEQVMGNLLSNALKFSERGQLVVVGIAAVGRFARLYVSDQGRGILASERTRIFMPFQVLDSADNRKKGGAGLGLSISKVIVEAHGGRIDFDSRPGVETTFYVDLPPFEKQQTPIGRKQDA